MRKKLLVLAIAAFVAVNSFGIASVVLDKPNVAAAAQSDSIYKVPIQTALDDMEEGSDGSPDYDSSDIEITHESASEDSDQQIGLRFANLQIPKGSKITKAYIQFSVDETDADKNNDPFNVKIYTEDATNPVSYENKTMTVSSRKKSTDFAEWKNIPHWTVEHEAGANEQTPDLTSLVQSAVNRDDWAEGNAINFIMTGSGTRCAESFEGAKGKTDQIPTLCLQFTTLKSQTVNWPIQAASDDMEEASAEAGEDAGKLDYDSSDLEITEEHADKQHIGLRFANLPVPKDAKISKAYVQFSVDETSDEKNVDPFDVKIYTEDAADPASYPDEKSAVSSRKKSADFVEWKDIPKWTVEHEAGANEQTPDLKALVQAVVNRSDWVQGNAINFILQGEGCRSAESFEGAGTNKDQIPTLHLEYTAEIPGGSSSSSPSSSAPSSSSSSSSQPDQTASGPYNINFSIGKDASQARFNWITTTNNLPYVQIAKAGAVGGTTVNGTVQVVTSTDNQGNGIVNHTTGEYDNRVTINGLQPATSYTYRVGDGKTWSDTYTFKTGNPSKGFSFAAFGDPQLGSGGGAAAHQAGWANTLKQVTEKYSNLDFLMSLGDQVNANSLVTQQDEYLKFFNPSNTNYIQRFPLMVIEGNHDTHLGTYYSFMYNQPNVSGLGSVYDDNVNLNNNDGDYWFRYGNTLFLVLNANHTDIAEHEQFMNQAVAQNKDARWKIACWHQSAYSEANHSDFSGITGGIGYIRTNWPTKLMDKYDVDVVLQGHDHSYTRTYQMLDGKPVSTEKANAVTDPKGTVYFTLDSGSGSKYYKFNENSDHSFSEVFWQQNQPTYSYISVSDTGFSIDTFRTDTGASIDHYAITKTETTQPSGSSSTPSSSSQPAGGSGTTSVPTSQSAVSSSDGVSNPGTGDANVYTLIAVAIILGSAALIVLLRSKVKKHGIS